MDPFGRIPVGNSTRKWPPSAQSSQGRSLGQFGSWKLFGAGAGLPFQSAGGLDIDRIAPALFRIQPFYELTVRDLNVAKPDKTQELA